VVVKDTVDASTGDTALPSNLSTGQAQNLSKITKHQSTMGMLPYKLAPNNDVRSRCSINIQMKTTQ